MLSQLSCYQMADIICKTGRSARLVSALMCPNDGFASCKGAVGVCMHVLKLTAWHKLDGLMAKLLLDVIVFPVCGICLCRLSFKKCQSMILKAVVLVVLFR